MVLQPVGERPARTQLQHHERTPVPEDAGVVDVGDVGVPRQGPGRGDLAHEAPPVTIVDQDPVVDLQRDLTADGELPGPVHDPEPALAEDVEHLVALDERGARLHS